MFLLDTNVISELRNGKPRQSAAVRAWAQMQPGNRLYLSAISVLEIEIGVRRMELKDPVQGAVLRRWATAAMQEFEGRVLAFSGFSALYCASLQVPNPRSFRDSMVSATAMEHGFAVATRNLRDFEGTGIQLVNPWDHPVGASGAGDRNCVA